MPKVDIDYSNTIIYKITCKDTNIKDVYVGHTTNFVQRKHAHKQSCNNLKNTSPCKLYQVIRSNGGWKNWIMEIVGFFNCNDHYEARKKEQEYFNLLNANLNSIEPMPKPKVVTPIEKPKIQKELYHCEICNIKFQNSKLFDIHKNTKKHVDKQNNTKFGSESSANFLCDICDYTTNRKSQYERHLLTAKHINLTNPNKKVLDWHECECGKKYKHLSSLCAHKKSCTFEKENSEENIITSEENTIVSEEKQNKTEEELKELKSMFMKMIEINQDLQKQIVELAKESKSIINSNNTTNTTNNNKFNLQIFLNEKCKDAFNITDFINGINVGFKDFENFGKIGYIGSISNIFIRELKELDVYKRPIHCSDLKREVIHVKDNNTWIKDEEKKQMKRAIKLIEHKNIKLIPDWVKANPEAENYTSKKHDEYNKMLGSVMGEMEDEDNERNYEKIIKNVAKETLIDKDQK